MKVIREVVCSKCGKKQVNHLDDLLKSDLFWEVCEFCKRHGLKARTRYRLTPRDWMEALYNTIGFRVVQVESLLKEMLRKGQEGM